MPSNWLNIDTNFPSFTGKESSDEKITTIQNYVYMLVEQMRYTLANLGVNNFNETEFANIADIITKPVYIQLKNAEGDIANLQFTTEGLTSQIKDAEGHISTLTQRADALSIQLKNAEGDISTLYQTADLMSLRIEDAEGNISTLTQTAYSFGVRISDAEGNISSLVQTADSLGTRIESANGHISTLYQTAESLSVQLTETKEGLTTRLDATAGELTSQITDANNNISALTQTVNSMTLSVSNGSSSSTIKLLADGATLSSKTIRFTGVVTFSDLEDSGSTEINGDNITTGTISAIDIEGCTFRSILEEDGTIGGEIEMCYQSASRVAGGIRLDDDGAGGSYEGTHRMFVYTNRVLGETFHLKLYSAGRTSIESEDNIVIKTDGGHVYVYGAEHVQIEAPDIYLDGNVSINGDVYIDGGLITSE